jgi:hypothetical protein
MAQSKKLFYKTLIYMPNYPRKRTNFKIEAKKFSCLCTFKQRLLVKVLAMERKNGVGVGDGGEEWPVDFVLSIKEGSAPPSFPARPVICLLQIENKQCDKLLGTYRHIAKLAVSGGGGPKGTSSRAFLGMV